MFMFGFAVLDCNAGLVADATPTKTRRDKAHKAALAGFMIGNKVS